MTAHKQKPTITPERVAWFAEYYRANPAWGVFHVALDDNNYTLGAASGAMGILDSQRQYDYRTRCLFIGLSWAATLCRAWELGNDVDCAFRNNWEPGRQRLAPGTVLR